MISAGPCSPAEPEAGAEDLGEGPGLHHDVRSQRPQGRRRRCGEAELAVGDVLQDQESVAAGQRDQLLPPRQRHRQPGRVLEVGDRVEDLRPQTAREQCAELVDAQSCVVDRDAVHVGLVAAEGHDRAEVGRRLDDDHVARVEVGLGDQLHAVDAAAGDHQLAGARRPALERGEPAGDVVADAGDSLGRRVLQRDGRIGGDQPLRDLGERLRRERLRRGEPAGERDHVGRAGQGEDRGDLPAAERLRAPGDVGVPVVPLHGCCHLVSHLLTVLSGPLTCDLTNVRIHPHLDLH